MRIFVALDLDDGIRQRIQTFVDGVQNFAPDARWVNAASLHVTLKFIGEKPMEIVEQVKSRLGQVQAEPLELTFGGYGFFPTAKAARVFWVGIQAGPQLVNLASRVDDITNSLGVPKETHPFSPHLTLARGRSGSGAPGRRKDDRANKVFTRLQEKLTALPDPQFGAITAREFFLYQSQLQRGGARYTKIAGFPLS
jgi:RNA 2',3'-cyclic 3'-phosphodiesterase